MFTPPDPKDFEDKPQTEMKRRDGSILRAYKHKTEPYRYRITIDNEPYNPTKNYEDAIARGEIKKK